MGQMVFIVFKLYFHKGGFFMQFLSEIYWDRGARESNQDSVSLQQVSIRGKRAVMALVCDGIGGLEQGEIASGYVAERMTEWFYTEGIRMLGKRKGWGKICRAGLRALYYCNGQMEEYGKKQGLKMGTAVTMLLASGKKYAVWHSGDTRLYRLRGGIRKTQVGRLTKDHTVNHHILVRCIGSFPWKEPDVLRGRIRRNQVMLLCTDGFRNKVTEEKIGEALQPTSLLSREQIGRRLEELAAYGKRHGETDNMAAVAIRCS